MSDQFGNHIVGFLMTQLKLIPLYYEKKSNALALGRDFLFCFVGNTVTGVVREDIRMAPGRDDLRSMVTLCLRCPGNEL